MEILKIVWLIILIGLPIHAQQLDLISFPAIKTPTVALNVNQLKVKKIIERIAGVKIPSTHPLLTELEPYAATGNIAAITQAATSLPLFYNLTVKQMATEISTRTLSKKEPMNDLAALLIGITRDELDGRLFVSGNLEYRPKTTAYIKNYNFNPYVPESSTNPKLNLFSIIRFNLENPTNDPLIAESNNNYYYYGYPKNAFVYLESYRHDFSKILERNNGQTHKMPFSSPSGAVMQAYIAPATDVAGALTTTTFLMEMAGDGRNRRMIQYGFNNFLCAPISEWADANQPDTHVPRDISRFPAGNHKIFQNTCVSCHSVMDGMKAAFNKIQTFGDRGENVYNSSVSKYGQYGDMQSDIIRKVNEVVIFQYGNITLDTNWENYATSDFHQKYFGWRGPTSGSTINELGTMMSNSVRYRACMAQKVVKSVCGKTSADENVKLMIEEQGLAFEQSSYNFKKLFQSVAADPRCLGAD